MNQTVTNSDSRKARRLLAFIEEFRKLSSDMQAGQIAVFLHVAGNPGISMKDIERRTGLSSSSVSRNVLSLSEWVKPPRSARPGSPSTPGVPGHDLVEAYEDPENRRSKLVHLKPRGIRVYNSLIHILEN